VSKKRLRRKVSALERRIREHEEKIAAEKLRADPDQGLISHWETEIKAFRKSLKKAKERLGGEK